MNAYIITLQHSAGSIRIKVTASRISEAVKAILAHELAPFRSIQAIKCLGPVFFERPSLECLKERGERLESAVNEASAALRAVAGVSSGPLSLTPDSVKARPDYIAARRAYDAAFKVLRDHNGALTKEQKRALADMRAKERDAKRGAP